MQLLDQEMCACLVGFAGSQLATTSHCQRQLSVAVMSCALALGRGDANRFGSPGPCSAVRWRPALRHVMWHVAWYVSDAVTRRAMTRNYQTNTCARSLLLLSHALQMREYFIAAVVEA
jgi:hypothetical protein